MNGPAAADSVVTALETNARETANLFRNCRNYWLGYACADASDERMTLYRSGVGNVQLNGVMWSGDENTGANIAEARRRLAGLPWAWWVGPDSHPSTAAMLIEAGAAEVGAAPVMAVETARMEPWPVPAGFTIEALPAEADLADWVRAYAPAMNIDSGEVSAMIRAERARADAPGLLTRFAAREGDRIVAVSELYMRDDVAGIYLVATDADYRRQGLGAALTAAAVRKGKEQGARLATLQATPLGRPLYQRLGFVSVAAYRIFAFGAG